MRNLKRALSLTLASVMLLGMMVVGSSALSFNDADDISNVTAATVLEELGVMQGDGQGNFMPEQSVTRAQMAILICRILYGDKLNVNQFTGTTQYTDVAADAYYTGYINLATQLGIIGGYGDGRFGPDDTVTTAQAALMLSRALGYFKANELADGDWALAAVAQATKIDMFGNLKLGTNELLARDNVCEMVFNTMTKAVPVQYSERWDLYYTDSNNVLGAIKFAYDETLAYRNFDLVYDADETDDFERPVTEWGIGTIRNNNYSGGLDDKGNIAENAALVKTSFIKEVNEADATYTKQVKVADIYKDLGLSETVRARNVYVYDDGAPVSSSDIKKNDTDTKYGGNGVLTQVFFFPGSRTSEDDRIVITKINTYTGETVRNVAASGSRDAYVLVATESDPDERPVDISGNLEYETDTKYDEATRVIYTYSQKEDRVVELAIPETASGTVTKTENANSAGDQGDHKALTIDGTRYEKSAKGAGVDFGSVSVKNDYTVYLDFYGYMVYVEETDLGNNNYALLINAASPSTFIGNRARLLFTDGTIKNVTTDKDYSGEDYYTIVTYRVDSDDEYTLKPVDETKSFINKGTSGAVTGTDGNLVAGDYADVFTLTNSKAAVKVDTNATNRNDGAAADIFHANSATAFVVADPGKDGNDSDFTAYTGIKNAPSLEASATTDEGVEAFWYCKNGDMISVMFIFPEEDVTVEDGNSNYIYIARKSTGNITSDKNDEVYIEYNTIIGGEVQTSKVKVSGDVTVKNAGTGTEYEDLDMTIDANGEFTNEIATANKETGIAGLYKSFTSNKRDVVTSVRGYDDYDDDTGDTGIIIGEGYKMRRDSGNNAAYTLILSNTTTDDTTLTVADNCKYFYVDKDGKINESSYKGLSSDPNDVFYAVVKDSEVQTFIVEQVGDPGATYTVDFTDGTSLASLNGKIDETLAQLTGIAKDGTATFTLTPKKGITIGEPSISPANGGTLTKSGNTYTISGITKNITVTVPTEGTVVEEIEATLAVDVSAQVEIGGKSYKDGDTVVLAAGDNTVKVTWGRTVPENGKVVSYDGELLVDEFVENEFILTAATADADKTITVGVATQKLTLPEDWAAAWEEETGKFPAGSFTAGSTEKVTYVPVGAEVTVTPKSAEIATGWYLYNPAQADEAKQMKSAANGSKLDAFEMPNEDVELTNDKYYSVALNNDPFTAAAPTVDGLTLTAELSETGLVKANDVLYVKQTEKFTINFTLEGTFGTTEAAADIKLAIGGTGVNTPGSSDSTFKSATVIITTGTHVIASDKDVDEVTADGTYIGSAKDIVIQYTVS